MERRVIQKTVNYNQPTISQIEGDDYISISGAIPDLEEERENYRKKDWDMSKLSIPLKEIKEEFERKDEGLQQLAEGLLQNEEMFEEILESAFRLLLLKENNYDKILKELEKENLPDIGYNDIQKIQKDFKYAFNQALEGRLSTPKRFWLYLSIENLREKSSNTFKLFYRAFLALYCVNIKVLKSLDEKNVIMIEDGEDAYTLLERTLDKAKEEGISYNKLLETVEEYGKEEIELETSLSKKEYESLGEYIKNLRENYNGKLTQTELGEAIGVPYTYVWKLENDKIQSPRPPMLDKLSEALDGDRDYMYVLSGKWPPTLPKTKSNLDLLKKYTTVAPEEYLKEMESKKSFGSYLKTCIRDLKRENRNITQRKIAEKSNISDGYLTKLLQDKKQPSARVLRDLASALDEDPIFLLKLLP